MGKYVAKRTLLAVLTVLIISAITFFSMHAIPGDPFSSEKAMAPGVLEALKARYGLDKPLGTQYLLYMKGILTRD